MLHCAKSDEYMDAVDAANKLLEKMKIDGPVGIDSKQIVLAIVQIILQHSKCASGKPFFFK